MLMSDGWWRRKDLWQPLDSSWTGRRGKTGFPCSAPQCVAAHGLLPLPPQPVTAGAVTDGKRSSCGDVFLRLAQVRAVWLCDRGCHRVAWLGKLLALAQDFVVRRQGDVTVHLPERAQILKHIKLKRGSHRDFGVV
jgi:hypothetical protein